MNNHEPNQFVSNPNLSLVRWLEVSYTSPATNLRLRHGRVVPNVTLRTLLDSLKPVCHSAAAEMGRLLIEFPDVMGSYDGVIRL